MAETVALALAEAGYMEAAFAIIDYAAAINFVATIAASSAYGSYQRGKARAAYNESLKDRELMIRSAVAPRRVIYGRDKVSGPIVYAESTGEKGEFLHLVIALAAHECDAVEEIWFNDVKLPTPSAGGLIMSGEFSRTEDFGHRVGGPVGPGGIYTLPEAADQILAVSYDGGTGDAGSGNYLLEGWTFTPGDSFVGGLTEGDPVTINYVVFDDVQPVRIKPHLGGAGQVADASLVAESGGNWTSAHVGAGICYLYVRLTYDTEIFGQIGVPNISAVVRGKKVFDPRTGTTAWSDNAALCVADWLRDGRYGLGASAAEVPDAEVIAAANICDETITLNVSGTATQKRYTTNTSFTTDRAPRDALADLLVGMAGACVWTQGRWLVRAGAYRSPSMVVSEDHLAGRGVTVVPKASRSELFNAVRVTYRDPSQAWAEVQAPLVTNAMYQAQDGGVRIVRNIQMPGAMDTWRAQRLAKIEMERARQALTVQFTGNMRAYDLSPTDTVSLSLARYGFSSKPFEVVERTWSPDGTLQYTVRETAAGVWAWNYGEATTVDLAPDTDLPNPYNSPDALTGLTAESGDARMLMLADGTVIARAWVQWDQSNSVFVLQGGRIDVQWKRDDADDWQAAGALPGDAVNTFLGPLPENRVVLIRVRPVNAAGRAGAWSTIALVPKGKTIPPPDVTGLAAAVVQGGVALMWDDCPEQTTYAATELRLGVDWATGTNIFTGKTNAHAFMDVPDGTYTVLAKHRDTSGNESVTAAPIEFTFTASGGISTSLRLSCSSEVVAVDEAGSFTPASITFTAFSAFTGSPAFTITGGTLTGSGASRTLAVSSMTGDSAMVEVSWGGQTDTRTVVKVYDGASIDVEYSITGASAWHSTFSTGDIYARYKRGASAWSSAVKIVGEDGAAGDYIDYIFKRAATQPATPAGTTPAGWADAPPAADGNPLWASTGQRTAAGALVGAWSTPARISGDDARGISARSTAGNAFVSSGAGTNWAPSLIVLSRELSSGLTTAGLTTWSIVAGTFTGSLTVINGVTGAPPGFGPGAMGSDVVTFRCTHVEGGISYYDDITVFKARDGVTAYLTNEYVGLPATNAGTVTSYSGANGAMRVVNGSGDVSTAGGALAFAIVGYTGFGSSYSAPGTSLDGGNITVSATGGTYAVTGGVTSAAVQATVTLRATYTNPLGGTQTFDRVLKIGKAVQGAAGNNGLAGTAGTRGSVRRFVAGWSSWNDAAATASVPSGAPLLDDEVTLYNGTTYAETRRWNGSSWVPPGTIINGSLLVTRSVTANALIANSITAASGVIADAAVGTLMIGADAVTVPVASVDTTDYVLTTTYQQVVTASFINAVATSGENPRTLLVQASVLLQSTGAATDSELIYLQLFRYFPSLGLEVSLGIGEIPVTIRGGAFQLETLPVADTATMSAGASYIYRLKVKRSAAPGWSITSLGASLYIMGAKR